MKKMLLTTALALLVRIFSTGVYCSKQTSGEVAHQNHHHHFFVSELGRRKLSMQPKFVAAQKILLSKAINIRKWITRF